jgi:hypothetical protein
MSGAATYTTSWPGVAASAASRIASARSYASTYDQKPSEWVGSRSQGPMLSS